MKKKNPYRPIAEISPEDAYKLGEVLELIYQLEILSRDLQGKMSVNLTMVSFVRINNCKDYMRKLSEKFPYYIKNRFDKGRKHGEKEAKALFIVLNKKQLKNYQQSLIDEADQLIEKNNL